MTIKSYGTTSLPSSQPTSPRSIFTIDDSCQSAGALTDDFDADEASPLILPSIRDTSKKELKSKQSTLGRVVEAISRGNGMKKQHQPEQQVSIIISNTGGDDVFHMNISNPLQGY